MKSLTNILRRSDLTPLERVTALVHNNVHKDKTGKGILSDAEFRSIAELWRPKNNYEVKEYNKYKKTSELEISMRMDAQIYLYRSENNLLKAHRVLDRRVFGYTELNDLTKHDRAKDHVSESASINLLTQHSYLVYDELVHKITFAHLPDNIQKDLIILDEEVRSDLTYLKDEVLLYELFGNTTALNDNQKKALVNIVYPAIYSEQFKNIRGCKEKHGFKFRHFFAGLAVIEILYKCADYLYVTYDKKDEKHLYGLLNDLQSYADSK
jgi:hypothetical protein